MMLIIIGNTGPLNIYFLKSAHAHNGNFIITQTQMEY